MSEYLRAIDRVTRRSDQSEEQTIRGVRSLLRELQTSIRQQVTATNLSDFDAHRLGILGQHIDGLMRDFSADLTRIARDGLTQQATYGQQSIDNPLGTLQGNFFIPSPQQVTSIAQFRVLVDLVNTNLVSMSNTAASQIVNVVRMTALGNGSSFEAMRQISQILGITSPRSGREIVRGITARGERVLRTELNRAFNMSAHDRMMTLDRELGGLEKQWMATGDSRTRQSHLDAHGQRVRVDKQFTVGGVKMLHPHDPKAPAREVVNCRCRGIVIFPSIGKIIDDTDRRVKRERSRRSE
jgi:hypothetical protein